MKHAKRRKNKQKERHRSQVAKELVTSGKYKQRIVKDKHGREHDLSKMSNRQLIDLIQDDDD